MTIKKTKSTEFSCQAPDAGSAILAGIFNDWQTEAAPMTKDDAGNWKTKLDLPPGRHESVSHVRFTHLLVALLLILVAIAIPPVPAVAQGVESDLSKQLLELQAKVMRLEAALNHQPKAAASMTQQPSAEGNQVPLQEQSTPGVPDGMRIAAGYQNCVQCHQTRPAGPLPPSHLEALSVSGQGGTQAAGGQESSGAGMGQMAQGDKGMQGMDGGKGMGGMGGGMGMGGNKGMGMMGGGGMGMGGDKKMGMGMMGGGMGMGGDKGMGMMGGGMGGGMNKGDSSQDSQDMTAMNGGGDSMGGSDTKPMESQMQEMQQQIQQLQQQMQQMMQVQMQMQLIQMKMMQPN